MFAGKKVLISAGPTYEAIDPVRFIGNRSSGKMGIALADTFAAQGAEVKLVLGPTHLRPEHSAVKCITVESAEQMYLVCNENFPQSDIVVMAAAVADYRVEQVAVEKIKKTESQLQLNLVKNKDILFELGQKKAQQCLVGFALESQKLEEYAREKLKKKNLDFIIANSATEQGVGFAGDTNRIMIIDRHNKIHNFELKPKKEVALDIVNFTKHYLGL